MCGRFALNHTPVTLADWYQATSMPDFVARYNIAPSTPIVVIRDTAEGRVGSLMRWGFIPAWAKDTAAVPMLNNARCETVAEKPTFRQAFQRRRCIVPASGFYEWQALPGQKTKQPFYLSHRDGSPMSLAGIWETVLTADGERLDTCAILTTGANAVMQPIHDRMPVILPRDNWDAWLIPGPVNLGQLHALMAPCAPQNMQACRVSTAVNRVANDGPELLEPIATLL